MDLVLNIFLYIALFTVFIIIMCEKNKGLKISYGKLILIAAIPIAAHILFRATSIFMLSSATYIFFDIVSSIALSGIRIWTCCMIFKTVTNNSQDLRHIILKEVRFWNILACTLLILSVLLITSENLLLLVSTNDFTLSPDSGNSLMNNLITFTDNSRRIAAIEGFHKLCEALIPITVMIPLVIHTKKVSDSTNNS